MINNKLKVCAVALLLSLGSCSEDFLEPVVSTEKDVETSVNSLQDLKTVLAGAYDRMNEPAYYGRDYIIFGEVRSDNAFANNKSGRFIGPGQFNLFPTDAYPTDTWTQIYRVIASANIVINAEVADNESSEVMHVKGQAYTIRALAYMDLLRLYGQQYVGGTLGVPIVLEFRGENLTPDRASVDAVWAQIGSDLTTAESMMSEELNSNSNVFITTWAVKALQSRYYLYTEEWAKAAAAAQAVIESGNFILESGAWAQDNSPSAIFELAYSENDNPNINSLQYILNATNYGDIEVTTDLYDLYEEGDARRALYSVNGDVIRMVGKYSTFDEDIKVIRYAEVVLNYAEALTQLNSPDALAALNMVPMKRGATPYEEATIENVLQERRKELAFEGTRFFDLMRYGMDIPFVDPGQTFSEAGIPFGSPSLAFPIPISEINANSNVVQNEGY